MLQKLLLTFQHAFEKGYIKNTSLEISKISNIYCKLNKKGTRFKWFIIYDNVEYSIDNVIDGRTHKNECFNGDFYCNKCGKFIGRFCVFDYVVKYNSNDIIPIEEYFSNNHRRRKLCKSCMHSILSSDPKTVAKKNATMAARYNEDDRKKISEKSIATRKKNQQQEDYVKLEDLTSIFVYDEYTNEIKNVVNRKMSKTSLKKLEILNNLDTSNLINITNEVVDNIKFGIDNKYIFIDFFEDILEIIDGIFYEKTSDLNTKRYFKFYIKIKGIVYRLKAKVHSFRLFGKLYCRECGQLISDKVDIFALILKDSNSGYLKDINDTDARSVKRTCSKCHRLVNGRDSATKAHETYLRKAKEDPNYLKDIRNKTAKTINKKYGGYGSAEWKKLFKTSGYVMHNGELIHNGNIPEVRAKMVATREKTIAAMSPEKRAEWTKKIMNKNCSKAEKEFIHALQFESSFDIIEHYGISVFHADGFYNNTIIEFYGDFFHANPKIYDAEELLRFHGKVTKVKDVWEKDRNRIKRIKNILNTNPNFIIVWEYDYNFNKERCIKVVSEKLKEFINNKTTNEVYTYSI